MNPFKSLAQILNKNTDRVSDFTKEDAAAMLNINPEALRVFEDSYKRHVLESDEVSENLFELNAKQAAEIQTKNQAELTKTAEAIAEQIISELLEQTEVLDYDGKTLTKIEFRPDITTRPVSLESVNTLPEELQPQLTGRYMRRDIDAPTYLVLLEHYQKYKQAKNQKERTVHYNLFRQGLDILDLDPVTYEILGMNMNTMGYWFPELARAIQEQSFFRLPKTKIMRVPITLLQLTRQDYFTLTATTKKILNDFCFKAFDLDENQDYFVKTGTYSSKFEFRNAHIHEPSEVHELGQYLLFIHFTACQAANPLATPKIYGMSTTNEWVVREYIQDKNNLPTIYNGLPLRTEYRVFVDFDKNQILAANPYWDKDVMLKRFGGEADSNTPEKIHDYIVYLSQADRLQETYDANIEMLKEKLIPVVKNINLPGQWSIDIMQEGSEFYIIDMATAQTSMYNDCIPENLRRTMEENWIPKLSE